jgi:peroxiredoxin (alkyl hydroperoxide reductase subunit C)
MATQDRVRVGQPAPDFDCKAVVDGRIKGETRIGLDSRSDSDCNTNIRSQQTEISLSTYTQAKHWLILIFFPKAWSFICPTEVTAFSSRLQEFLYSRSCAVAFASTDSEYTLRAWNSTSEMEGGLGGVHVPLISDCNHKLSRDYGVLMEDEGVAERALFIIDPKGNIRSMTINDADVGRSVDEAQRILDALIFKDEFGEGCPVNWKKGDKGIDIAAKSKVEGPVEIDARKSWVDYVRPKLGRTWSGTSHASSRSLNSISAVVHPVRPGPVRYNSNGEGLDASGISIADERTPPRSEVVSGNRSPLSHSAHGSIHQGTLGPGNLVTSANKDLASLDMQLNQAMVQQQLDNMQAALTNQRLGRDIGLAS